MTSATLTQAPPATQAEGAHEKVRQIGKSRVQFDLTPRAVALLGELKEKTDAATYAEVFRNAMKLYDGIITEIERGSTFLIRDKDGRVSEFRMFL
jgi:hypothetical protein